ncbi:myozenin-1b isoform X1 [Melanotaenia boesemani]|uniref:myozenin-1b isoform X1 n=1 Tax=Melanotaenia boesemani TaxID=1250792 RepID=UPI001C052002|nr:myozenin-1b isoform X1 [Melanotaenia boesemani]
MPFTTPAPSNKRKKANKIITDLSHISQNEDESDPDAAEFDLGTKIKTPRDVMLEELSLLKNKGSKMFRMRQQRVEKFIVTSENMVRVRKTNGLLMFFEPTFSVQHYISCLFFFQQNLQNLLMSPPVPPKPEMPKEEKVEEKVNEEVERAKRRKEYVRTYISPWERAMRGNEDLEATMKACMPGPIQIHPEMPQYKSFNRTALPFGGFDKASKMLTFELPQLSAANEEPEPLPSLQADIRSRPSFNRTPIGWVCSEDNSHIHMGPDIPFDGETDDL